MRDFSVADMDMAPKGKQKLDWAWQYMPVLSSLERRYSGERPFDGVRLAACLHLEAKTACLLRTFARLGAEIFAAGSNPLSTQDDVCAALVSEGVHVFSHRGMDHDSYFGYLRDVLSSDPEIIVDDGADLVATLLDERKDLIGKVKGGSEETTSGVKRLKAMERQGILPFPMISVNDADSKYLFDNRYGTGQSVWDGVMRTTNSLIAGKVVVVAGYGWCGRGVAMRAKALGARVVVTEINPHRAFEALMDGHEVMTMDSAAPLGDIFLTLTGNLDVINARHMDKMKDGVILGNAGHFDVEISKSDLTSIASSVSEVRPNVTCYRTKDGRNIYLLGEGRLVNLAAGDGHPIEIMDLSFALQLLSALHIQRSHGDMESRLYPVPEDIDRLVVSTKLESLGVSLDELSESQKAYMVDWRE
ncbi:adenosylhomocysteinase [Dethiosulfovibrio peptidovorans DSM 11002]|uniref:Adenosylhomocysteinase n=1 Tax=Dethiosulfovibrio peptidovorans DSM 11002 TaxID=469381 RepID=D2Z418_9BACT|nr:adenosylhomocysteinase [Dethiosulfovibrio peptidovorans]EFC92279.1 adenosylhomocysteinase [Dethiosulfovibrio peptidovorans DSM 11002]